MAYKDSGALPIGQSYQLGDYVFSITVSHDPGESETGINVRCDKGDERARVASEVTGTVESWRVEANENTADVYVSILDSSGFTATQNAIVTNAGVISTNNGSRSPMSKKNNGKAAALISTSLHGGEWIGICILSTNQDAAAGITPGGVGQSGSHVIDGVPIYYYDVGTNDRYGGGTTYTNPLGVPVFDVPIADESGKMSAAQVRNAMALLDFRLVPDSKLDVLVARFAIDLHDAGGTGTGSDWDDPGDYDQDRDPEDPPTTLELAVTGASAGTHSALPAEKTTVKPYGSGGDGGNGGGGGAGASTVIVRRFATDRADSKEITATARPHGYGSGGGKGGKGGDGCVLIFY